MKKLLLLLFLSITFSTFIYSQAPQAVKYQSVVRDGLGNVLQNTSISLRINIVQNNPDGSIVYNETFSTKTNQFGLFNIEIGKGIPVTGIFKDISWKDDIYFIKVEADITAGTDYKFLGTSQILSVPYSFYSDKAGYAFHFDTPVLTNEDRDTIKNPKEGMLIYNKSTKCLNVYQISNWFEICPSACVPQPTKATAGLDQLNVQDTITQLFGNAPTVGIGVWSIVNGNNGTIDEPNNQYSKFHGKANTLYTLRWSIYNKCDTSYDEVLVFIKPDAGKLPIEGQILIKNGAAISPNATIYYEGNVYQTSTVFLPNGFCIVTIKDSVYMAYNTGKDTLQNLSMENSILAIFKLMQDTSQTSELSEKKLKSLPGNYKFKTGIQMDLVSDGYYKFTNLKARWAGVKIDDKEPFTLKDKELLNEISISKFVAEMMGIFFEKEPIDKVTTKVKTFGSPFRAYLLSPNLQSLISNPELQASIEKAKLEDPDFYERVVQADALSLSLNTFRKIIKTISIPLGECANLVSDVAAGAVGTPAWIMVQSDAAPEYDAAKQEVYKQSCQIMASLTTCTVSAAVSATGVGHILNVTQKALVEAYNNIAFYTNKIKGIVDASTTLAYDEVTLNSSTPCPGLASFSYGGQTYNTVLIGSQCWMKENLNIGTRIDGVNNQTNNATIEKYCYNNDPANCNVYGGLYQWNEMMQYVTTEKTKGICPNGWHIPSDAEWTSLADYLGGYLVAGGKMKEAGIAHWLSPNTGATNESDLSFLPDGYRDVNDGTFGNLGLYANIWSSSENYGTLAWGRHLVCSYADVFRLSHDETYGFSVRCLKD